MTRASCPSIWITTPSPVTGDTARLGEVNAFLLRNSDDTGRDRCLLTPSHVDVYWLLLTESVNNSQSRIAT